MSATPADLARWQAERERDVMMAFDARSAVWLGWRVELTFILWREPFGWPLRKAWGYALALLQQALRDWRSGEDWLAPPSDALAEDRQYWDD